MRKSDSCTLWGIFPTSWMDDIGMCHAMIFESLDFCICQTTSSCPSFSKRVVWTRSLLRVHYVLRHVVYQDTGCTSQGWSMFQYSRKVGFKEIIALCRGSPQQSSLDQSPLVSQPQSCEHQLNGSHSWEKNILGCTVSSGKQYSLYS